MRNLSIWILFVMTGILASAGMNNSLSAQSFEDSQIYIYWGQTPFMMETDYYEIQLNSRADESPFPSFVELNQLGMTKANQIGLGFLWPENRVALEADWKFEGGFSAIGLSGLWRPAKGLGGRESPFGFLRLSVSGSYVWGEIGEVGSHQGDVYLLTPDGEEYLSGSKINVWGLAFGGDLGAGIGFRTSNRSEILVSGGYRHMTSIDGDRWRYTVKDDGGGRSSELPSEGFDREPPALEQSGPMFQITLVFGLN